eukprot:6213721-Pleurochrysis_carterae.AAC.3
MRNKSIAHRLTADACKMHSGNTPCSRVMKTKCPVQANTACQRIKRSANLRRPRGRGRPSRRQRAPSRVLCVRGEGRPASEKRQR